MQECAITAALTGLGLQSCCHVLVFSPVRLKAVLPCREALLWFTFFQIVKLWALQSSFPQTLQPLCSLPNSWSDLFFSGWLFLPILGWNPLSTATSSSRDVITYVMFGWGAPADYGGDDPAFYLNIPSSCGCRNDVALPPPPPCTGIHPIMRAAPSIHTHWKELWVLPDITGGLASISRARRCWNLQSL